MTTNRSTEFINSALAKHVKRFTRVNNTYCPTTVGDGLDKIHGSVPYLKGTVIATFNATHANINSVCPITGQGNFTPDAKTGFAKNLHLGTTRIWKADGSIDEERWQSFVNFVTADQNNNSEKYVTKSKLMQYLHKCANEDSQEISTGRNTNSFFSSKYLQCQAAVKGWDEVFDRLTEGFVPTKNDYEPYISLSLIRLFFEDSEAAFVKAESTELPVTKPTYETQQKLSA